MIDEFLSAWYRWTHYKRNGNKTKKEILEDMDREIDYEDIELEEEKEEDHQEEK